MDGVLVAAYGEMCGIGCPVGGVRPVFRRAFCNGHGGLWRVAIAARPSAEDKARAGGIDEREGLALYTEGGGIGTCHAATGKVVGDGVGIEGIGGADGHVLIGHGERRA